MRAFIEAAAVETRFRLILRDMRERHVRRFAHTYRGLSGDGLVGGVSVAVAAEALACMVEQCCYVWFAQAEENGTALNAAPSAASPARSPAACPACPR